MWVDTETKPTRISDTKVRHKLWFGCAEYMRIRVDRGRETRQSDSLEFDTSDQFWDYVEDHTRSNTKLVIMAHNWNYDGAILSAGESLKARGWECQQYVNERVPLFIRMKKGRKYICLVDTLNYFSMSLDKLGEYMGTRKLDFPSYDEPRDVWSRYCWRDVHVLRDAFLTYRQFLIDNKLGNWRPTLAGQAWNGFRHSHYDNNIFIHDNMGVMSRLERPSYHGGRVECALIGTTNKELYYLDVNSLYPYIMSTTEVPCKLLGTNRNPTMNDLKRAVLENSVIARVDIDTNEAAYPLKRNKLIFPVGKFTTELTTPELAYALDSGHIKAVHEFAIYEPALIFKRYVDSLYALRREFIDAGRTDMSLVAKLLLNSLYGRFGMRGRRWINERDSTDDDPISYVQQMYEGAPIEHYRVRFGQVQHLQRDEEAPESFPAIAAHITAAARMHMFRLMERVKGHWFYSDTDSLIVDRVGYERLIDDISNDLGALKLESTHPKGGTFYGPKDYQLVGSQPVIKGIKKDAEIIAPGTYEQYQWNSYDFHLSKGEEGYIDLNLVRKHLKRDYSDKGYIDERSGAVLPIRIA